MESAVCDEIRRIEANHWGIAVNSSTACTEFRQIAACCGEFDYTATRTTIYYALQRIAQHSRVCGGLRRTVTNFVKLQRIGLCITICAELRRIAVDCGELRCIAATCNELWRIAAACDELRRLATNYGEL